ncbi:protein of unknown function [Taphrina deformans PYCC 5710]|uniref:Uncharacterized protein n=1 Tax=Taphrina deformans (strain PYCC 5710 / ATCC 11124 / CBS 356.35 / IMI 108563 / JCM 9778 / NBRC 8474) TaxID=1097556 RepID=R4XE66_TAPDE|nr:protein of unknown function [Taphrina deformans PYCC 5710]|eukprot:CCG81642.1 protein of unknown function [Taphrina deformans PYCC 5710]
MEQPYILTKLHKSTSTSDIKVFAGNTLAGSRVSSKEVVLAIDSQGVNVYNIRSNQVANSYSLSPATKFQCPPISSVDRTLSIRRTYAALQTGADEMKVRCWTERSLDSDTEVTTYVTKTAVGRIYVLADCVLLLYANGNLERHTLDLASVVETIAGNEYLGNTKGTVLQTSTISSLATPDEVELHLVMSNDTGVKLYHIKISTTSEAASDKGTAFYVDDIKVGRKLQQPQNDHFALTDGARLAIALPSNSHTDILYFERPSAEAQTLRVPHAANSGTSNKTHLEWLNATQFIILIGASMSIWETAFKTCQASLGLERTCNLLAMVPQKSASGVKSGTMLVMSTNTDIYLSQATFTKQTTLMSAIGKQPRAKKEKESWLQDVPIQSTWKDSISSITQQAKSCLAALEHAKSGSEIDAILEEFLFPEGEEQGRKSKQSKKHAGNHQQVNGLPNGKKANASENQSVMATDSNASNSGLQNGHAHKAQLAESIGDESEDEEKQLTDILEREVKDQVYPTLETFSSYDTDVSLSVPFITSLLRVIFVKLPAIADQKASVFPAATIDFLLRKNLLSLSSFSRAGIELEVLIKSYPDLRLRIVRDVSGLLPAHLIAILQSCIVEAEPARKLISAVLSRLDNFDEALIVDAVRSGLRQEQILMLLQLLSDELQERLEKHLDTPTLTISDETACASITVLIDSFGISNIMFSKTSLALISRLRTSMAQVISQHELIGSTDCCVSELLMKARLLETSNKPKTVFAADRLPSNPEPEPRRGEMPLDKVKKTEKGLGQRAKAHARVQGIGSLYTIETLQI